MNEYSLAVVRSSGSLDGIAEDAFEAAKDKIKEALNEELQKEGMEPLPDPLTVDSFKGWLKTQGVERLRPILYAKFGIDITDIFGEDGEVDWTRVVFVIVQAVTGVDGYDLYAAVRDGNNYEIAKEAVGVTAGGICFGIAGQDAGGECQDGVLLLFNAGEFAVEAAAWLYNKAAEWAEDAYDFFACDVLGYCEDPPTELINVRTDPALRMALVGQWYAYFAPDRLQNIILLRTDALMILEMAKKFAQAFESTTGSKMTIGQALTALERNGLNTLKNKLFGYLAPRTTDKKTVSEQNETIDEWEIPFRIATAKDKIDPNAGRPWITKWDDPKYLFSADVLGKRQVPRTEPKNFPYTEFVITYTIFGVKDGVPVHYPPWVRTLKVDSLSTLEPDFDPPEPWVYDQGYTWSRHITTGSGAGCQSAAWDWIDLPLPVVRPTPELPCGDPGWSQQALDGEVLVAPYLPLDSVIRTSIATKTTHLLIEAAAADALKKSMSDLQRAFSISKMTGKPVDAESFASKGPDGKPEGGQSLASDEGGSEEGKASEGMSTGAKVAIGLAVAAAAWVGYRVYTDQPIVPGARKQ